jgi:hypothetical protein
VVEVRLRRVLAALRDLGDVAERQLLEHPQLDDQPLLGREPLDGGAQLGGAAAPGRGFVVIGSLDGERGLGDLARLLARVVAQVVEREVDGDAVEPGAERRVAAEVRDLLERAHERALRQVLCLVLVLQIAHREVPDRSAVAPHQLVEAARVAVAEARDQDRVLVGSSGFSGLHHLGSSRQGHAHIGSTRAVAEGKKFEVQFVGDGAREWRRAVGVPLTKPERESEIKKRRTIMSILARLIPGSLLSAALLLAPAMAFADPHPVAGAREVRHGVRQEARGERMQRRGERIEARGARIEARGERAERRANLLAATGRPLRAQAARLRGARVEARGARVEARGARVEARGERKELRGERNVARGEAREGLGR